MTIRSWKHHARKRTLPSSYYTWQLARPGRPALPASYFWTWDHSCNWMLDDPGLQSGGCYNRYFKAPETFVEDYRRLTDLAAGLGIKGIVIWGFLRDTHGGIEASKKVAAYAAQKGVAIMPGFGTTWYGGAYYEGNHPYNMDTFLEKYPEARMLDKDGRPMAYSGKYGACLAHPAYQEWLRESLAWLYREFEIGGLNLENGDYLVDYHPAVQALRKEWPEDDPDVFFHQGMSYRQALEAVSDRLGDTLNAYATYSGFQYTDTLTQNTGMGRRPPAMLKLLPPQALCQWTLTGMLLPEPLPLTAYLDDGAPAAAFDNPNWPADLKPPAPRNVGFVHQGSQWSNVGRNQCIVGTIKEACLRAYRSGLEGVSIHGEMTARHIPYALNYLAFSHFTHWPEDNLREFGRKTLGAVLGSEADGETFAEVMAYWDAGTATEEHKKLAQAGAHGIRDIRSCGSAGLDVDEYQRFRFWEWLDWMVKNNFKRCDSGVGTVGW